MKGNQPMNNGKAKYGMVIPRFGSYGVCGYDAIVKDCACILFRTKKLAVKWLKSHGYDVLKY